ncbi:MAG: hypothetical protein U0003_05730 [Vampirovibrionales bacterium]
MSDTLMNVSTPPKNTPITIGLNTPFIQRYRRQPVMVAKVMSALHQLPAHQNDLNDFVTFTTLPPQPEGSTADAPPFRVKMKLLPQSDTDSTLGLLVTCEPPLPIDRAQQFFNQFLFLGPLAQGFARHMARQLSGQCMKIPTPSGASAKRKKSELKHVLRWLKNAYGVKPRWSDWQEDARDPKRTTRQLLAFLPPEKRKAL